jgi:hypothetical protein
MLNTAKIIRVLGYILYNILWSPFIILTLIFAPIMVLGIGLRNGWRFKDVGQELLKELKNLANHDKKFIKTGEW